MKKLGIIGVAMFFVAVLCSSCEKETIGGDDLLPQAARNYITQHFPSHTILQVKKDKDVLETSFDVILSGQFELDFNKKGECTSVDGNGKKIPNSVVPAAILTYVQANYAQEEIWKWEVDDREQEVELSSGMDLVFDKNGNFKRIDL